jgi:hypothetical protein
VAYVQIPPIWVPGSSRVSAAHGTTGAAAAEVAEQALTVTIAVAQASTASGVHRRCMGFPSSLKGVTDHGDRHGKWAWSIRGSGGSFA